jgi:hypothetical protein
MNKSEMLSLLRFYLADPIGKIWNDDLLNDILDQALEQYSIDSGAFTGRFDFFPDENGIYHYPEDFVSFLIGWSPSGKEITPGSAAELFRRQGFKLNKKGEPQNIFDDQSNKGNFELYPCPEQNTVTMDFEPFYGEILNELYGVFADENYGITATLTEFDFAGDIFYRRKGKFEEVKDHNAVIYYALFLAYNSDTDMSNADNSAIWRERYIDRINRFSAIGYHNSGTTRTANFY